LVGLVQSLGRTISAEYIVLVYEDEHLEVVRHDGNPDYLLITFNEMEIAANGSRFWGQRPCEKASISALGFMSRRPNWFPAASVAAAARHLQETLHSHPERILMGHSQGGYAALRYAGLLGASVSLAFCPQISIDPRDVPRDSRFRAFFCEELHAGMAIGAGDISGRSYVFFDPHHPADRAQVSQILAVAPEMTLMPVPMTGHSTIKTFAGTSSLVELVAAARAGSVAGIRALINGRRRSNVDRPYHVAMALIARHPALADQVFNTHHASLQPRHVANFCYHRANRMIRDAELDQANALLKRAIGLTPLPGFVRRLEELSNRQARERAASA
jgi:pimeloyl-ACP methyl ester carboxylesterase